MKISRNSKSYIALRGLRGRLIKASKRLSGVHPSASVHQTCSVSRDLVADEFVFIGRRCNIAPLVRIGRYTMFASDVAIVGDDHRWHDPETPIQFAGRPHQRSTSVGRDVWIGHGAVIMRGITIGDGSIVAAGAVVTRDVPSYEVWAGIPAKRIRDRFEGPEAVERHQHMLNGPLLAPTYAEPREISGRDPKGPQ